MHSCRVFEVRVARRRRSAFANCYNLSMRLEDGRLVHLSENALVLAAAGGGSGANEERGLGGIAGLKGGWRYVNERD